jgi:hypothetical protein
MSLHCQSSWHQTRLNRCQMQEEVLLFLQKYRAEEVGGAPSPASLLYYEMSVSVAKINTIQNGRIVYLSSFNACVIPIHIQEAVEHIKMERKIPGKPGKHDDPPAKTTVLYQLSSLTTSEL